jgi:hypothetical protein
MKLYGLCIVIIGIVIAIFGSGCAGSVEMAPQAPIERPGQVSVEFTDSTPHSFVHETLATRLAHNEATRPISRR